MKRIIILMLMMLLSLNIVGASKLTEDQLKNGIEERLVEQLGDEGTAELIANFLMEDILTWKAETLDVKKSESILAFAFGNGIAKNGNQTPGKMNEQLADLTVDLYKKINKPVYAQWEIAQAIGDRIPESDLFPIYPSIDEGGNLVYLNTTGVALDAVKQAGGFEKMGKTLVVAFYEHSTRAVKTAKEAGLEAYAPEGYEMPSDYDKGSGQPWTRDRNTFILYEIRTRANSKRAEINDGVIYKK